MGRCKGDAIEDWCEMSVEVLVHLDCGWWGEPGAGGGRRSIGACACADLPI